MDIFSKHNEFVVNNTVSSIGNDSHTGIQTRSCRPGNGTDSIDESLQRHFNVIESEYIWIVIIISSTNI